MRDLLRFCVLSTTLLLVVAPSVALAQIAALPFSAFQFRQVGVPNLGSLSVLTKVDNEWQFLDFSDPLNPQLVPVNGLEDVSADSQVTATDFHFADFDSDGFLDLCFISASTLIGASSSCALSKVPALRVLCCVLPAWKRPIKSSM